MIKIALKLCSLQHAFQHCFHDLKSDVWFDPAVFDHVRDWNEKCELINYIEHIHTNWTYQRTIVFFDTMIAPRCSKNGNEEIILMQPFW